MAGGLNEHSTSCHVAHLRPIDMCEGFDRQMRQGIVLDRGFRGLNLEAAALLRGSRSARMKGLAGNNNTNYIKTTLG